MADDAIRGVKLFAEFLQAYSWVTALSFIIVGVLLSAMGWRALRYIIPVVGCVTAIVVGASVGQGLFQIVGAIALGILFGVIAIAILYRFYVAAVFLVGSGCGFVVAHFALAAAGHEPVPVMIGLVGFMGGVMALTIGTWVIMGATAIFGGALAVVGTINLLMAPTGTAAWTTASSLSNTLRTQGFAGLAIWALAGWGLVTLCGLLIQTLSGRKTAS